MSRKTLKHFVNLRGTLVAIMIVLSKCVTTSQNVHIKPVIWHLPHIKPLSSAALNKPAFRFLPGLNLCTKNNTDFASMSGKLVAHNCEYWRSLLGHMSCDPAQHLSARSVVMAGHRGRPVAAVCVVLEGKDLTCWVCCLQRGCAVV